MVNIRQTVLIATILLLSASVIIHTSPVPERTTELQNNQVCGIKEWAECKAFLQEHLDKDSVEYKQLQDINDTYDSPLEPALNGHIELIQVLIRNGVPVNKKYGEWKEAMLNMAAAGGQDNVVALLLTHGADIHVKDYSGSTPLHRAVRFHHTSTVRLLLDSGADVNITNGFEQSPLYRAVINFIVPIPEEYQFSNDYISQPHEEENISCVSVKNIIDLLLERGADTNIDDAWAFTPLHVAAKYDKLDIVKLLLERGANIIATDGDNKSALYVATENNNVSVVEYLLAIGCDKTITDRHEETALDIAKRKNFTKLVDILSKKEH